MRTVDQPPARVSQLRTLDFSVIQQCMHCGLCLPTCPTYAATKVERHSPRGRISLMRAIAEEQMETTRTFADEMYFCLGCLAWCWCFTRDPIDCLFNRPCWGLHLAQVASITN